MKNLKIYVIVLMVILPSLSCKKLLTETPYSFLTPANFPQSSTDADAALVGAYSSLQTVNMFRQVAAWAFSGQDDLTHPAANVLTNTTALFTSFQVAGSDLVPQNFWTDMWKGVNACNGLIGTLQKLDPVANTWVTAKLAEARALRGLYYFYLVRAYGDLPLKLDLTTTEVVVQPRVSAITIYSTILDDLTFADNKLATIANGNGRFTNGAVKGLLVQVYMTMAGWRRSSQGQMVQGDPKYYQMAITKAQEVLAMETSGVYALEPVYSNIFVDLSTDAYSKEVIMDVEFALPNEGSEFPYLFGAAGGANANNGSGEAYARTNKEFCATLDFNDTRVQWNIANYQFSGWTKTASTDPNNFGIAKYQKIPTYPLSYTAFFTHPTNWPLIRLDDIKLLYAEALNEVNNGPTPDAYAQINAIRYRARPATGKTGGTVAPDLAGLSHDQFLAAIQKERAIEFIMEGIRHFDLIRWGVLVPFVQAASSQPAATYVNPRHYLLPIPAQDLVINHWTQNDGY